MLRKKSVIYGKKMGGGYQTSPEANFQHTFRKYLLDPPLDLTLFFEFECMNMLDIADYDSTYDSGLLRNH